jgi:hypothetical protein
MSRKKTATTPTTPKKQKKATRPATPAADDPAATPIPAEPTTGPQTIPAEEPAVAQAAPQPATKKQPRTRKAKEAAGDGKEKKLSALDAAAKVLAETGQPMNCQEMIDAMAAKGYWTSPGGKTPAATLYSAILRELTKGADSRFAKTERGKFARKS